MGVARQVGSTLGEILPPDLIDSRVKEIDHWIDCAGRALQTFFIEEKGGFRRSTLSAETDSATSTCRGILAMAEQRRVWEERGLDVDALSAKIGLATERWILPMGKKGTLEGLRGRSGNQANAFTDAQLLTVAALTPSLRSLLPTGSFESGISGIKKSTAALARDLVCRIEMRGGGSIELGQDGGAVHDFITMHAVRGVDAHAAAFGIDENRWPGQLAERIQDRALGQLAYHSAGVLSRYDPAELLFSTALLLRFETANCSELTQRAIEIVADSQTEDGAWPSSRVVSYEAKARLLHVASYEVALTMATVAYREAVRPGGLNDRLLCSAVESLNKSMRLITSGYIEDGIHAGWANDRTRWDGLIEGWATAIVLMFLVRYREVLLTIQQRRILQRYRGAEPSTPPISWPELEPLIRVPGQPNVEPLGPTSYSDPTSNRALSRAMQDRVLKPIAEDPVQRPSDRGTALLLYGKPGTRKTSLVKRLADCLSWPVVTLSPPNFLSDGGLEGFEESADKIFRDLMRLQRCVVLFDECEDFFKPRDAPDGDNSSSDERVESRTIGAFLTAGMLPRLQDLRDRRWVVFVLATNSGLEDLDEAVIRPGRFDFAQSIDHPTLPAQLQYVQFHRQPLSTPQKKSLTTALKSLKQATDKPLPFAVIDEVARELTAGRIDESKEALVEALRIGRERKGPPPLLPQGKAG